MSQEILYTSAQKGLRPGTFGFCTVCATAGLEPNMADFLEGISAYPHPYKPPDPNTVLNPVNYSHIVWTVGGQRYHILSRVCDAGLDYTGRTNLLAHHVALTRREAESARGGPGWLLQSPGFIIERWDGQLRTLPGQPPLSDEEPPLAVCRHWKEATGGAAGDAGYAGALADACKDKGGRPVTVIYKPRTDVLALVNEALSLLPPEKRWGVTFSTFYTKTYSSFECQWRFVFSGSPDAALARKNPHSLVLDLTSGKLPPLPDCDFVEMARTGQRVTRAAAAPLTASTGSVSFTRTRRPDLPPVPPPPSPTFDEETRLRPPSLGPAEATAAAPSVPNPFQASRARQKFSYLTLAVAFVGSLAASLFIILTYMLLQQPKQGLQAGLPVPPSNGVKPVERPVEIRNPIVPAPPPMNVMTPTTVPETPVLPPEPPDPPVATVPEPVKPMPMVPAPPERDPFEDIMDRKKQLALPSWSGGSGLSSNPVNTSGSILANIFVTSPQDCVLELSGIDKAFGALPGKIVMRPEDKGETRKWMVIREKGGLVTKDATLATFKLEGKNLSFYWDANVSPSLKPNALRFCMLEVHVGDRMVECRLSSPELVQAIKVDKFPTTQRDLEPRLDASQLPDIKNLMLEIRPVGFPGRFLQQPDEPIAVSKSQKILVYGPEKAVLIQLEARFDFDKGNEGKRGIVVFCKEAYLKNSVKELTDEDALGIAKPLNLSEMKKRRVDHEGKIGNFERDRIKLEKTLVGQRPRLEFEIKELEKVIGKLRAGGEREKEAAKTRQEEKEALEAELQRLEAGVNSLVQKRDGEKFTVEQIDAAMKLANEISKGRLEFCVFVMVGEDRIELYKSKDFPKENEDTPKEDKVVPKENKEEPLET